MSALKYRSIPIHKNVWLIVGGLVLFCVVLSVQPARSRYKIRITDDLFSEVFSPKVAIIVAEVTAKIRLGVVNHSSRSDGEIECMLYDLKLRTLQTLADGGRAALQLSSIKYCEILSRSVSLGYRLAVLEPGESYILFVDVEGEPRMVHDVYAEYLMLGVVSEKIVVPRDMKGVMISDWFFRVWLSKPGRNIKDRRQIVIFDDLCRAVRPRHLELGFLSALSSVEPKRPVIDIQTDLASLKQLCN
jgi:hypothetical protein